jgi:hypothetical protein
MKIAKESLVVVMIIPVLILVGPTNMYAKDSPSTSSTSSTSSTTPSNYAIKPGAFLSKCNFTSNAISDVTNGTSIALNQHDLGENHWTLKPSPNGPTRGAYVCLLEIVPNRP